MENIRLPLALGIIGFVFSTKRWIKFMDGLSPTAGLFVYYSILTTVILLLEWAGLIISGINFTSFNQALGTILIIFSFFIVVDWESCYINYVTKGNCENVSNVYLQSEDGAVYSLWSKYLSPENARLATYVVTPIILSFIGLSMITHKITIAPF